MNNSGSSSASGSGSEVAGPDTADGTLVIIVCRAKHLPNRRKLDKQCPYVTMRIGPTAKKTPSHFRAGQTPEWTHEIRFELTRERRPMMKLDVLDETKNEPTPIGLCEIDCSIVFGNPANKEVGGKYIHDDWYDLSCNGRRAGKVFLEMTFYPSSPVLPPKIPKTQGQSMATADEYTPYAQQQQSTGVPSRPLAVASGSTGSSAGSGSVPSFGGFPQSVARSEPFSGQSIVSGSGGSGSGSGSYGTQEFSTRSRHSVESPTRGRSSVDELLQQPRHTKSRSPRKYEESPSTSTTYAVDFKSGAVSTSPDSKSRFSKFSKLKLKFQSRQPVGTLFQEGRSRSPNPQEESFEHQPRITKSSSPTKSRSFYQLPGIPSNSSPKITYSDDDDDDFEPYIPQTNLPNQKQYNPISHHPAEYSSGTPPPPPHKDRLDGRLSHGSTISSNIFSNVSASDRDRLTYSTGSNNSHSSSRSSPGRKPPPPMKENELSSKLLKMSLQSSTAIPFSADTFGIDEDEVSVSNSFDVEANNMMPTLVYLLDKPTKSLSHRGGIQDDDAYQTNPNEIDPKYYAPSPTEHLSKTLRLQNGQGTRNDVQVDLRTESSGYLGDGKWQQSNSGNKFSPLVFDRMPSSVDEDDFNDDENKPAVPPKVPKGLSEIEYYVLEKEKYLRDINGRRA